MWSCGKLVPMRSMRPATLHHARRVPVQVVVNEHAAILQVLSLGQHIGGDHQVDFFRAAREIGFMIGVRRE